MILVVTLALGAAGSPTSASPYDVPWVLDGTALVAMSAYMYLEPWGSPKRPDCARHDGACDPATVPGFDRGVLGNHSDTWAEVSDWTRNGTKLLAAGMVTGDALLADSTEPGLDVLRDGLVIAVSVTSADFVTHLGKRGFSRPRPSQYDASTYKETGGNQRSMPSGHVTSAAAVSAAYSTTFALRHPDSPWLYAVIAAGAGLTAATAVGRMNAGQHFPSDVLVGAIVGGSLGVVVPLLHRRELSLAPVLGAGSAGVVLQGRL